MNKTEFIAAVVEKTGLSKKDVTVAVEGFQDVVTETLASGDNVQLVGFGNFEVRGRAARKGRNPQTGDEIEIPETKTPAFKSGKKLKDAVK